MKVRVPKIIEETQALNPDYPAPIQQALTELRESIESDRPIPMIELPAPDYEEWAELYKPHAGETWLHSDWFFAEIYFYRLFIQAVRWWETGRDPFAPKKEEEISSAALWEFLELALAETNLAALLQYTLWGNRIDLSYAAARAHGRTWKAEDLIADDSAKVTAYLSSNHEPVHFIADNAGTEIAADLAFLDALLADGTRQVVYHVKMHPTFVSDSTAHDVVSFIERMTAHSQPIQALGRRLREAIVDGRIRVAPDLYWNSTRWLWDLPARLTSLFEKAALVIVKGDANYRRVVGDALWEADIPLAPITDYFPAPLLLVRTMKSDTVVGLQPGQAKQLDQIDAEWRINGRRGLIQFRGR
jgi:uncharacterized protein with ATP-grasp and redox domains